MNQIIIIIGALLAEGFVGFALGLAVNMSPIINEPPFVGENVEQDQ